MRIPGHNQMAHVLQLVENVKTNLIIVTARTLRVNAVVLLLANVVPREVMEGP